MKTCQNFTESSDNYEVAQISNTNNYEIKKYLGFEQEEMTIPTEINGKRIVGIGLNAFCQCRRLEKLIVPEGIEYISEGAFYECSNLSSITLPNSLKQLSSSYVHEDSGFFKGTFQGTAISEIDLPDGIFTIGDYCFMECNKMKKITLPANLIKIGTRAFEGCTNLEEVILPSMVKTLDRFAFYKCNNLSKIELNEGLTTIGTCAFGQCQNMRKLYIPKSVTSFGIDFLGVLGSSGNKNVTIVCYPGSKAIVQARSFNIAVENAENAD